MILNGADAHDTIDHQPEARRLEAIAGGFHYLGYKGDHAVNAAAQRSS